MQKEGGKQMSIQTIAVVGAGTMGRGIIETAATHGINVLAVEVDETQREAAAALIEQSVDRAIKRGKLDVDDPAEVLGRIDYVDNLQSAVEDAQFVIEAVSENEELKLSIFKKLNSACPADVVLASNTSSISITRLASATTRPAQVIGMHFFNPVPVMAPVEIVCGAETSESTIETTRTLAEQMGKQAFAVQDKPGFVVNRVLMPLINEAVFALQDGVADADTIDSLMKLGCNHPMGPLQLADLVGLDVCLSILQVLHRDLADEKFRPCPLLEQKVAAGQLGRKSSQGFYQY